MEGVLTVFSVWFRPVSVGSSSWNKSFLQMAIQLVTGMALNLEGLHSVYEMGERGFDVAGYQLMVTHPHFSSMK